MAKGKLTDQAPVLLVRDVVKSAAYWRDCLGFKERLWGDPPGFAICRRDACFIMLSQAPEGHEIVPNWKIVDKMWNAYFWVDDARAIYAEFQASGARIDYSLYEAPYGVLEFGIQDLDGHDIAFGQDLD
ncbi:MAG: bleomycin resistance protein [Phyllobacteriaceae bacterium]|nr:bleomycin resistance protein [Phyllobacteriaceae bacterium]